MIFLINKHTQLLQTNVIEFNDRRYWRQHEIIKIF